MVSVVVRPPEATGWDEYATCNGCGGRPLVAVLEFDNGNNGTTNVIRLCEPCMDALVKGVVIIKLALAGIELDAPMHGVCPIHDEQADEHGRCAECYERTAEAAEAERDERRLWDQR